MENATGIKKPRRDLVPAGKNPGEVRIHTNTGRTTEIDIVMRWKSFLTLIDIHMENQKKIAAGQGKTVPDIDKQKSAGNQDMNEFEVMLHGIR